MIFIIYENPIAQCRHRMNRGRAYDPRAADKKRLKEIVASQMKMAGFKQFKNGPLSLKLSVYTPVAKSSSKKRVRELLNMGWDVSAPDCDNFAKFYMDFLTGVAYEDDRYISELTVVKQKSLEPRVEVEIKTLKNLYS